jgi:hypothetical protein
MIATVIILAGLSTGSAHASIFTDDFNAGAFSLWGNESGDWAASDGKYSAQTLSGYPHAYSSLPFNLRDFTVDVDVIGVMDGGIWLRSNEPDNGVILVTGGYSSTTNFLYWHETNGFNDPGPVYNVAEGLFN